MQSPPVIVGYSQILAALRDDASAPLTEARNAVEKVSPDSDVADDLMGMFHEALSELEQVETNAAVMSSAQNQMASALQSWLAENAVKNGKTEERRSGILEAKFDKNDWAGWVGSFFSWFSRLKKVPFLPPSTSYVMEAKKFRIAVLGDWGTGMYGAPVIAQTVKHDGKFDIILHLGDVYYAGTHEEEQNRFLSLWPNISSARNYALNSNHEMYSGGHGYFGTLLKDPRFALYQTSSCLSLENEFFVLIGLDTAYANHDLFPDQMPWLEQILISAGDRKVILFSHHQPFSSLDKQGPKLQARLAKYLNAGRIFAWYWGHEHRCVIYERHDRWRMYGRCVGHSGFPEFRGMIAGLSIHPAHGEPWKALQKKLYAPEAIVLDGENPFVADNPSKYLPHGYMVLEFVDNTLVESVHDAEGKQLYAAVLT
jgi:predicted phosphodiesterase